MSGHLPARGLGEEGERRKLWHSWALDPSSQEKQGEQENSLGSHVVPQEICNCCPALSGSVTLGRDILCQSFDRPGKPSHGAKRNTWNAPAGAKNWTELL